MSKERELLERWVMQNNFAEYYALREESVTFLTQPEQEQEVYTKGYAEAMRQQVYEAFEAGRKSATSEAWNKEREDAMSEAWNLGQPETYTELTRMPVGMCSDAECNSFRKRIGLDE